MTFGTMQNGITYGLVIETTRWFVNNDKDKYSCYVWVANQDHIDGYYMRCRMTVTFFLNTTFVKSVEISDYEPSDNFNVQE
jgi:hypothetical protein